MNLTKTLLLLSTAGFLAACDETMMAPTSGGGSPAASGGTDASLIRDAGLIGQLDSATQSGNAVVYAYYTDVVSDTRVLAGADAYCGGAGHAVINLTRGDRGGRGYNSMAFTCR